MDRRPRTWAPVQPVVHVLGQHHPGQIIANQYRFLLQSLTSFRGYRNAVIRQTDRVTLKLCLLFSPLNGVISCIWALPQCVLPSYFIPLQSLTLPIIHDSSFEVYFNRYASVYRPQLVWLLQRGRIACNEQRCISHGNYVCLSVCLSHAGTLPRWMKVGSCGLHCEVAKHSSLLTPTMVWGRRPLPPKICAQSDPPPLKSADFDPLNRKS